MSAQYGGRDAACPLSTGEGTRRVRLVPGWGVMGFTSVFTRPPPIPTASPPVTSHAVPWVQAEARQQGAVDSDTYMFYLRELRFPLLAAIGVVGALSQAARNGNDWWLTRWASGAPRAQSQRLFLCQSRLRVGETLNPPHMKLT